ncbi:MAG: mechanosensitive ion channel family protein [Spirochaetaceae bacterium]
MSTLIRGVFSLEGPEHISWEIVEALLILVVGSLLVRLLAGVFTRSFLRGMKNQSRVATRKTITYVGIGILAIAALDHLGVELTALLGAAGVIGIAVGIASQASLSNVISGLFLVSEKTFELGDVIKVGDRTGVVHSIDPLSIKLRTFDNLLVRIPNQQIIDSELVNVTRFPIRRLDVIFSVPAEEPVDTVMEILRNTAKSIDLCLDEPEPFILLRGIVKGNIECQLGVWFEKENFVRVKNAVISEIQRRFLEHGLPFGAEMVRLGKTSAERGNSDRSQQLYHG